MATTQVLDIKTSFNIDQALNNLKTFTKTFTDFSSNVLDGNDELIDKFTDFNKTITDFAEESSDSFGGLEKTITDFASETTNSFDELQKGIDNITLENLSKNATDTAKNLNKVDKEIDDVSSASKTAKNSIEDLDNATDKLGDSLKNAEKKAESAADAFRDVGKGADVSAREMKASSVALEALKDNLGGIPVVGNTLTRVLDGVGGSFAQVAKAAAPVAAVAAALLAVGAAAVASYKNSEKLRGSIGNLGNSTKVALSGMGAWFGALGDNIAVAVDWVNNLITSINKATGALAEYNAKQNAITSKRLTEEVNSKIDAYNLEIDALKDLQLSQEQYATKSAEALSKMHQNIAGSATATLSQLNQNTEDIKKTIAELEEMKAKIESGNSSNLKTKLLNLVGIDSEREKLEKVNKQLAEQRKLLEENEKTKNTIRNSFKKTLQEEEKSLATPKIDVKVPEIKEKTPYQILQEQLADVAKSHDRAMDLAKQLGGTEEEVAERIKEAHASALSEQDRLITEYYKNVEGASLGDKVSNVLQLDEATGNLIKTNGKLGDSYVNINDSLAKLNAEEEKPAGSGLTEQLNAIAENAQKSIELAEQAGGTEEEIAERVKQVKIDALTQQQQALEEYYKTADGADFDSQVDGVLELDEATGKLVQTTDKLGDAYKKTNDNIKKLGKEGNKSLADMLNLAQQGLMLASTTFSSIFSFANELISNQTENYDEYNQHIYDAETELQEYLESIKEEDSAKDDEDYETKMARLEEEMQKAIEAQDAMSINAIQDKMEELKAEKAKKDEEKKIAKEREETQKQLEKNIANAEYQKELAVWENQVKAAEQQKNMSIAQSAAQAAMGIAMASVGAATTFAQTGIFGAAAGLAMAASMIATIGSAASGITSAVKQYENVKANPPQPPKFAIGTGGYALGAGESAIVGELGAEAVTNMGDGRIAVKTARQTDYEGGGSSSGTIIENVQVFIQGITDKYDLIASLKSLNAADLA